MSQSHSSTSSDQSSDSYPDQSENTEASSSQNPDPQKPSKASGSKMLSERPGKRSGKRPGRKPSKIDVKAKLERSRQSARECRARKKLRYQYLEELVLNREQAIFSLRDELEVYKQWCIQVDKGIVTDKLINVIQEDASSRSSSSYPRSRQTSTVTSGTQSPFRTSSSAQKSPGIGGFENMTQSRTFDQGSHFSSSGVTFTGSRMSSQVHGAGAQVQDTGLHFPTTSHLSDGNTVSRSNIQMTRSDIGQFPGSQFVGDSMNTGSMYSNPSLYDMSSIDSMTDYRNPAVTTASQGFINLSNMNIPNTCTVPEDPVATLTAITNPSSILPTYDMAVSYNPQPSSSQTTNSAAHDVSSWYSFLADLEPGLARQGAESASGTPQSVDGIRTLPTVLQDFHDSDSSSDT